MDALSRDSPTAQKPPGLSAVAHSEIAPAPLAFELEDEGASLIGDKGSYDEQRAVSPLPMPIWVFPVLVAAVCPHHPYSCSTSTVLCPFWG